MKKRVTIQVANPTTTVIQTLTIKSKPEMTVALTVFATLFYPVLVVAAALLANLL
jgi:hypothetical protein